MSSSQLDITLAVFSKNVQSEMLDYIRYLSNLFQICSIPTHDFINRFIQPIPVPDSDPETLLTQEEEGHHGKLSERSQQRAHVETQFRRHNLQTDSGSRTKENDLLEEEDASDATAVSDGTTETQSGQGGKNPSVQVPGSVEQESFSDQAKKRATTTTSQVWRAPTPGKRHEQWSFQKCRSP